MIQSVQHKPGCGVVVRMDDGKVWAFDAKKYLFKTRINGQWMLFIPTEKQRALIFVQWEKAERAHRAATETPEQRAARIKLEVQAEMDRTNRRNAYRIMNHDQQWRSEERNA